MMADGTREGCAIRRTIVNRASMSAGTSDTSQPPPDDGLARQNDLQRRQRFGQQRNMFHTGAAARVRQAACPTAEGAIVSRPARVPTCQTAARRSISLIGALNATAIISTSSTPANTCGLSRMVR
jgi:hypothetical protein